MSGQYAQQQRKEPSPWPCASAREASSPPTSPSSIRSMARPAASGHLPQCVMGSTTDLNYNAANSSRLHESGSMGCRFMASSSFQSMCLRDPCIICLSVLVSVSDPASWLAAATAASMAAASMAATALSNWQSCLSSLGQCPCLSQPPAQVPAAAAACQGQSSKDRQQVV